MDIQNPIHYFGHMRNEVFQGQHCETTATGNLLYHHDIHLSEPMMFGLGEGLGFIFLNLKTLNLPFVGGRSKPFELTTALCSNLGLKLECRETSSRTKARENILDVVANGTPVGLQLDSFYLDYFSSKIHFAGHAVACLGIEADRAVIVDTKQQGGIHKVTLSDLEKARFEKGPMSAKARSWTIEAPSKDIDLPKAITNAIRKNARTYLKPAFKGMSFLGIEKLAHSLPTWLKLCKTPDDLVLASRLMERAGTGGSIFRCFYRDFLAESSKLLNSKPLNQSHLSFIEIAEDWRNVAALIEESGRTSSEEPLKSAAQICATLAIKEKKAMEVLNRI
ncbi:BtrH N-terminal domain-containing protein [Bdellovibrio bacteriovorus]|uniref:BtrH N-terminal domain-containing protein n=1 Tax=Bdellovibrio TaxID=958 RepID=UPI0035A8A6FF